MSASKVSSANLERSYRRAPKGAGDQGVLEVAGAGVCHLCTCGQGVDWENMFLCLIWDIYLFLLVFLWHNDEFLYIYIYMHCFFAGSQTIYNFNIRKGLQGSMCKWPVCFPRTAAENVMDQSYCVPQPVPWDRESPFTRELYHDASPNGAQRFHCLDPWHTIHLGVGKHWIGCGAFMLQRLIPMRNMDQRIEELGLQYKAFCRENKLDPILRAIDLRTFGGPTTPFGSWNKAAVTSNMMLFFEHFCDQWSDSIQRDERMNNWVSFLQVLVFKTVSDFFSFIFVWYMFGIFWACCFVHGVGVSSPTLGVWLEALATKRLNCFMRTIYKYDFFLPKEVGVEVAGHLYFFVRSYLFQAHAAYQLNLDHFHLIPKVHGLHEIGHTLKRQTTFAQWCINPAIYICSCDEDFIGRLAFVSRQVSPRLQAKRTLSRYLCHINIIWSRGG